MKSLTQKLLFLLLLVLLTTGNDCTLLNLIGQNKPMDWELSDVGNAINNIINWFLDGAATITIIFIMVGGVQYISSFGNPEQNQKAKNTLTYAVIGLVLILSSYAIIKFLTSYILKQNLFE